MTDDLVKRLRELEQWIRKPDVPALTLSCDLFDEAADRIEQLESVTKDDAKWLAAYHQWCKMNGCAPSSSDLIAASKALEGKDDQRR
jgi:hypothetical protein